jgi:heme-degrading monooxygenase HmoA
MMQPPPNHHLAQLNIGRIRYEVDDARMADFTNNLAMVNGLAERTPGFVLRSTSTRPYADPRIAINLSVWENVEALERIVYQAIHKRFYGRRAEWFEHFEAPYFVMWWVPAGHRPSVEEAIARLDHLKQHGPSDHAFDWQTSSVQLWKTARCAPSESAA